MIRKQELRRLLARACAPLKYTEYIEGHGTSRFKSLHELLTECFTSENASVPTCDRLTVPLPLK